MLNHEELKQKLEEIYPDVREIVKSWKKTAIGWRTWIKLGSETGPTKIVLTLTYTSPVRSKNIPGMFTANAVAEEIPISQLRKLGDLTTKLQKFLNKKCPQLKVTRSPLLLGAQNEDHGEQVVTITCSKK